MASAFKNLAPKRKYRERHQPASRAHLGALEKKPDYQRRAKHYHKNEHILKKMREKVYFRNPDEFDFGMIKSTTVNGQHQSIDDSDDETVSILRRNKDTNLVNAKLQQTKRKAEKLHKGLHFTDTTAEGYKELLDTLDTVETLDRTYKKIKLDKDLASKDRKKEVEPGVYKWFRERKR